MTAISNEVVEVDGIANGVAIQDLHSSEPVEDAVENEEVQPAENGTDVIAATGAPSEVAEEVDAEAAEPGNSDSSKVELQSDKSIDNEVVEEEEEEEEENLIEDKVLDLDEAEYNEGNGVEDASEEEQEREVALERKVLETDSEVRPCIVMTYIIHFVRYYSYSNLQCF